MSSVRLILECQMLTNFFLSDVRFKKEWAISGVGKYPLMGPMKLSLSTKKSMTTLIFNLKHLLF